MGGNHRPSIELPPCALPRLAHSCVVKVTKKSMKAMKKGAKAMKTVKKIKAKQKSTIKKKRAAHKKKPSSWIKQRPQGCAKCRNVPGCTPSCWQGRGGAPA